jgi:hypothetical protein
MCVKAVHASRLCVAYFVDARAEGRYKQLTAWASCEFQMILSTETRRKKLSELRSNSEASIGKQKLYYKKETQSFEVFRIDLDWLIYNRNNGRMEAEMLTWQQELSISPTGYDQRLHEQIEKFLWESNEGRNKQTLKDLQLKQQQRPGIVSLDGVIIDGNRRAMLLKRLAKDSKGYFDAIILPDAYDENQGEIVRLETQYQLGEDAKVEYGPLQKYLHARRLHLEFEVPPEEIEQLMGAKPGTAKRLLGIMKLMDDYLEHIQCPKLYTMLQDDDGTKEGMFVDLFNDLERLKNGNLRVPWDFDPEIDPVALRVIQFDFMRLNEFTDAKKSYREISHQSKHNNFFSHKEIWEQFRDNHQATVDTVTTELGTLEEFIARNPPFATRVDAARARDTEWKSRCSDAMRANFGRSSSKLEVKVSEYKPREFLERAKDLLARVEIDRDSFLQDPEIPELVRDCNRLTYEMKRKLDRS